jgi:hypothetical protein
MRYLTLTRTLVYYDGPQLLLGKDGKGTKYLALGVPSAEVTQLFLAVGVSEGKLNDYFGETVDLRNVFRHPKRDRYFTFSLDHNISGRFLLKEQPVVDDNWLPSAGFFASLHTEPMDDAEKLGTQVMNIPINGRWDMQDLAQFSNKYTDAYAFLYATTREPVPEFKNAGSDFFSELFQRYPWRGGYSSVSFYNDLYRAIAPKQRVRIREIHYASPGVIQVEASAMLEQHIRTIVLRVNEDWRVIKDAYRDLYDGLSERKFLGLSRHEIQPTKKDEIFAQQSALRLSSAIKFDGLQRVYSLCGKDWITAAKILLSFYRRIEELADFYDSGKAAFELTADQ